MDRTLISWTVGPSGLQLRVARKPTEDSEEYTTSIFLRKDGLFPNYTASQPEDGILHSNRCRNLKSNIKFARHLQRQVHFLSFTCFIFSFLKTTFSFSSSLPSSCLKIFLSVFLLFLSFSFSSPFLFSVFSPPSISFSLSYII
jgi:hypothetical protein